MDIKKILSWIVEDSINGEFLSIIDVPEEGDESYEQNEGWWISMLGACPPYPVKPGKYLYFCTDSISDYCFPDEDYDAEVDAGDDCRFLLYKIE